MMPAALWWRLVSVWLCVLALVSWHPSCYVGCTEQLQKATSLPAQDIVSEEEQSENTQTAEESWVSHVHSLSDDELMTAGQGPGEDLDTPALAEEDEDEDQGPEAVRADEPAAVVKLETVTDDAAAAAAAAAAAPAGEPEPDAQLPDTPPPTITQDQQPAVSPEPSPASPASSGVDVTPDAVSDSAEAPSISASQDQTLSSGSDHVESDMPPLEPSDEHLATTDCEAGEANPYDDASPPVVLENTSNAHIAGTKTHADPAMSPQPARSAESLGGNTSHMLKEKGLSPPVAAETQTQTDSSAGSKDPEDYPTFDEWKRKVLEVEKEKTQATHTSTNGAPVPVKKVPKNFNNYASVECGAKILGSNPEAKSTSAILMENMDMYMLNPCSNKIWFIIELCEPIQLKQLDIANFELFSSTPKDFLVSISDRYPTNKWLKLGTFHGRDERTVQSFPLDEHVYAKYVKMFTKYIKVELISHFGSEHFCPLSLIRVFGTSMVEEYEEIADPSERPDDQDDDLDYPPGYVPGEINSSKNLIGSAKDAILNMVNTAANVFGGSSEMQGNASFQELNMTEPPLQTEANTEAAGSATTVAPMPDAEEAEILVDSDIPATEAPLLDLPTPELPITESTELELPPVEDGIVTLLPEDVEESISSTITLLGEEEDEDEEREAKEKRQRQYERTDCCGPFSFSSHPSSSTLCSCSSSLQEYLMQQCSTRLSKQRKAQIPESKATITPHPYLPALKVPLSPPASPLAQPPHTEINQPQDQELDPGAAETASGPSEVPHIPGNVTEPQTESVSEPTLLEPSQTSSLPKPSATESPTAKSTPAAELPQHSSKGLPKEPRPDGSQDEQAVEKQGGTTVSPSVSVPVPDRPSGSAAVEHVSVPPTDDKPKLDFSQSGQDPPLLASESAEPAHTPQPSTTSEQQPVPPAVPENGSPAPEELLPAPTTASEPDHSEGLSATATESKVDLDLTEDMIFTSTNGQLPRPSSTSPPSSSSSSPIHSEFYAELHNMTEQGNGNQVHGSSQNKESVFMRLNNRIKALEMNMSLSGRYLEQLSQRYRKQMEEMQKAFNKTIIKLQNTARMAEEQDLRQTESIQSLQGQLENITQLVLNLSVRVSQLQSEVSDRQSYLLASLTLCLFLGLILCANRCNASADIEPPDLLAEQPEPPEPRSYSNCERQFASCDDTWLKRRASYPLLHSDSLQIPTTEGPESLPTVETQRFSPANRKKRRAKVKAREGVETLKASLPAPELTNGFAACNGVPHAANPANRLLHPAFKDSPSEGSSEGGSSSHSDDPSFCGIATVCTRLYDGLPPARTKSERRALRRRRPKPVSSVVDLLQAPRRDKSDHLPASSTLQDLRSNELSSGTFNTALSGPA